MGETNSISFNNVTKGAEFIFGQKNTNNAQSTNKAKATSIWVDCNSQYTEHIKLAAKYERCNTTWNTCKNKFGFGEKMSKEETSQYQELNR